MSFNWIELIEYAVLLSICHWRICKYHDFFKLLKTVKILTLTCLSLLQACLADQASVQQSLQQLQALGEQLKSQVDASSSAALQSDHLSLTDRLAMLEHALHRQQEVLQVGLQGLVGMDRMTYMSLFLTYISNIWKGIWLVDHSVFSLCLLDFFVVWISGLWRFHRAVGHTDP